MKKLILFMCLMVALCGIAQAELVYENDDFDKTKYIYSYFHLIGVKEVGLEIKDVTFKKHIISENNITYTLSFVNTEISYEGKNRFALDNNFLVKFDNDDKEIYTLPIKDNVLHMWGAVGSYDRLAGFHEIILNVPESVINKILTSSVTTLKIPLATEDATKTGIRSITFDVSENIVKEWRDVIRSK